MDFPTHIPEGYRPWLVHIETKNGPDIPQQAWISWEDKVVLIPESEEVFLPGRRVFLFFEDPLQKGVRVLAESRPEKEDILFIGESCNRPLLYKVRLRFWFRRDGLIP